MKGFFLVAALLAIITGGLYYTLTSKSYKLSSEAESLYEQGNYSDAYDRVNEALKYNRLNRQAISLRPKLRRIVEGSDRLAEADNLYEDALNQALAGNIDKAKLEMSQAYELAKKVPGLSPSKPLANDLMDKIVRDTEQVINQAPEMQFRNALKYLGDGDTVRAYEAMSNIDPKTERIKEKMSEVAYTIGDERYQSIKTSSKPTKAMVDDAVYWLSKVDKKNSGYKDAVSKMKELKTIVITQSGGN